MKQVVNRNGKPILGWIVGVVMLLGWFQTGSAAEVKVIQRFSECHCTCTYSGVQGKPQQGMFNFFPQANNTSCQYTAIDIYVPCYDSAGQLHPGTNFSNCKYVPGIMPTAPATTKPQAKP
ncbi:MAG TPA: hypothetical protein VMO00_08625 [Methylomirabilota bacterium]|nr:hypothetical protein [Methylomirabilota bacterium]